MSPSALTRALLAAGVEPALVQSAYQRSHDAKTSFEDELSALGLDWEAALADRTSDEGGLPERLGDHALGRELGRGGMGAVYVATHLPTGTERALKVLRADAGAELVERFQREAEGLARAGQHENVVSVHASGREGPWLWIAMDLVAGESLHARLKRGALSLEAARAVATGIARGLAHVHAQGVLHRDLKPENVLLDADGRPRLVDFGLARLTWQHSLTETGVLLGTPHYMAPEQAEGLELDERADVYALGGLLFTCLSGQAPFQGPTLLALLDEVLRREPPRIASLRPEVPPDLDALCAAALAKDPERRPRSALAFLHVLEGRGEAPRGGSDALWAGVATLGLGLVLALGGWLALRPAGSPPASTSASPRGRRERCAQVLAGTLPELAEVARLRAWARALARRDPERARAILAAALAEQEWRFLGQEPAPDSGEGLRLEPAGRDLVRLVGSIQEEGRFRRGDIEELRRLAAALEVEPWLARWELRLAISEARNRIESSRDLVSAGAILARVCGAEVGYPHNDRARVEAARVVVGPRSVPVRRLVEAVDASLEAAIEEICVAQAGGRASNDQTKRWLERIERHAELAWRIEALRGEPLVLPRFVAFLTSKRLEVLSVPSRHRWQLYQHLLAPDLALLTSHGLQSSVAEALRTGPAAFRPRLAALWADQLVRVDPARLVAESERVLEAVEGTGAERSIAHEKVGLAYRALGRLRPRKQAALWGKARDHLLVAAEEQMISRYRIWHNLAELGVESGDLAGAQRALQRLQEETYVPPGSPDEWDGRRVYVLRDAASLVASTPLDDPTFAPRVAILHAAAERYVAVTREDRDKRLHAGSSMLRAAIAQVLAGGAADRELVGRALEDLPPGLTAGEVELLLRAKVERIETLNLLHKLQSLVPR